MAHNRSPLGHFLSATLKWGVGACR